MNYPYDRTSALERIREKIPFFTDDEFDLLIEKNKIYWIFIDGKMHFSARFFETLCKIDADFAKRAGAAKPGASKHILHAVDRMRNQGEMAVRLQGRAVLKVKDEFFRPGEKLRVTLPIPCMTDSQEEICIERVYPEGGTITTGNLGQRVVFWEKELKRNESFSVVFSLIRRQKYIDFRRKPHGMEDWSSVRLDDVSELDPHIVFSPFIKSLASEITAGAEGALEKARRIYDYVTLNVRYRFMPEYFCLENIPENCLRTLTGDCGIQALTLIALCRASGIPARWESGWVMRPDFCGCHDWARIFIAPWGWVHADPSFGGGAVRDGDEDRRRFYFGNVDPWRMAANNAFGADFDVPRDGWRCDPYDNQSGEAEYEEHALMWHELETSKEVLSADEI